MKPRKMAFLALSAVALAFGAAALSISGNRTAALEADAADYSRSSRSVSINNGSLSASLTVSSNALDMRGWLLCLFSSKPAFDPSSRKLDNSNDLHPYSVDGCLHYFYVENNAATGALDLTWAANSADQKYAWNKDGGVGTEGYRLQDVIDDQDWHFVIGPRHFNDAWPGDEEGAGKQDIWENCDYYLGQKSALLSEYPSGDIYLDLSQSDFWQNDGAKFGVYLFDNNDHSAFTDFASPVAGQAGIYLVSYDVSFEPTGMIGMRYKNNAEVPSMENKWNQTADLPFYENGVIGVTSESSWAKPLASTSGLEKDIVLDLYKRNASKQAENYVESLHLDAGDEFVISFNGKTFNTYSTHSSLTSAFALNEGKIHVNTAGEYALYFNTTQDAESLYITTTDLAFADDWALSFLGANCAETKSNWIESRDLYSGLPNGAKTIIRTVEHEPDPTKVLQGYVAQAVQRYDYVLTIYPDSYSDFLGRIDAGLLPVNTPVASSNIASESKTPILVVTLIGVALAAGLACFALSRKRKGNN